MNGEYTNDDSHVFRFTNDDSHVFIGKHSQQPPQVTENPFRSASGMTARPLKVVGAAPAAASDSDGTESTGAGSNEELAELERQVAADIYTQCGGDSTKIAKALRLSMTGLQANPPSDADEFAAKLLEGALSANPTEDAEMREQLRSVAQNRAAYKLRRVDRSAAKPAEAAAMYHVSAKQADVAMFAQVYSNLSGDLGQLSDVFELDEKKVRAEANMPIDAEDFATKLLDGIFTGEVHEWQKKQLMLKLKHLKPSTTKEALAESTQEDLAAAAQLYIDQDGDIAKIASVLRHPLRPPKHQETNPEDFAKNLVTGKYQEIPTEANKARLLQQLKESYAQRASVQN